LDVRPVVAAAEQPPCPAMCAQRVGEGGEIGGRGAVQEVAELLGRELAQTAGELVGRLALAHRERVPAEAVVPGLVQQVGELLVLLVGEHLCDVVMMLDRGFLLSVMGWDRGAAVPALGLALGGASLGTVGSAGGVLLLGVVGGLCASVLQICAGGVDVARQRSPPLPEVL